MSVERVSVTLHMHLVKDKEQAVTASTAVSKVKRNTY